MGLRFAPGLLILVLPSIVLKAERMYRPKKRLSCSHTATVNDIMNLLHRGKGRGFMLPTTAVNGDGLLQVLQHWTVGF